MARLPENLSNRRGQAMVESLALSAALMAVLGALAAVLYYGFVHVSLNYLLHEFLVCERTMGATRCDQDFQRKARVVLFAGELLRFESHSRWGEPSARVVVKMPLNREMTLRKEWRRAQ